MKYSMQPGFHDGIKKAPEEEFLEQGGEKNSEEREDVGVARRAKEIVQGDVFRHGEQVTERQQEHREGNSAQQIDHPVRGPIPANGVENVATAAGRKQTVHQEHD